MPKESNEHVQRRLEKLARLEARGIKPYPNRYHRSHTNQEAVDMFIGTESASQEGIQLEKISLAGRITNIRIMGKTSFANIRDGTNNIQVYARRDTLGEGYSLLKDLDLGDFIGVEGTLIRTRTGEISLDAISITLLAKALRPPPEKWHGLSDVETRYRQRYLDLIANSRVRELFKLRSHVISAIRTFLDSRGFWEVETPVLVPVAAGAMAMPFVTHHKALDRTLYLRIATELYLKRLIVGGFDAVYEIGRVFRNEGIDADHNPEFTLLESYQAYSDYTDVMEMVEDMISTVALQTLGTTKVSFESYNIDLSPPWKRIELRHALKDASDIDLFDDKYADLQVLRSEMVRRGLNVDSLSPAQLYDKLISHYVEPTLIQPTFLIDYPIEMSPLAKQKEDNPRLVERFEGFVGGIEVANSFTELNDPEEQRNRLLEQQNSRQEFQDEESERWDEDFLTALEYGMPPTGGLGMGIDRLVMLLSANSTIREAILFPQLRTKEPM